MRRTPAAPSWRWMWSQMVEMAGPARLAAASRARVFGGVRAGRSGSAMRCQPRGARRCSRRSWPVLGSRSPGQPGHEPSDQPLVNIRRRDALLVQPGTEDRGGSHVPAHGARRVPARHEYVDEVVDPAAQRPGPDLLADAWANRERFKAWSPPWPLALGGPALQSVLCQAHGDANARHARGNGAPLTVTCHNATLVIPDWTEPLPRRSAMGVALLADGAGGRSTRRCM